MINPPESYRRALEAKNLKDADFLLKNAGKVISDYIKKNMIYTEVCVKSACEFVNGITHLDWILSESYHKRRISEFSSSFRPINIVTKNGFIESLKVLLKHGYKITYDSDIYTSYNNGDKKMMQYLLENTIFHFKNQQHLLSIAIDNGYVRDLAYLLNNWRFKVFSNYHNIFEALQRAAKYKNRPKCFKLLLSANYKNSEVSPYVFYNVCYYGGIEQARILIDEYGMSPSLDQNMPIISACEGGNISMIKFLLKYPEVNVFDRNNKAYYRAKKNSLQDVLDLLDDYKSNGCQLEKKTFKSCYSIRQKYNLKERFEKACYDNDHHLVKSILDEYLEDISSYDILLYIIKRPSHIQIFNLLIHDWRFRFKREMLRKILYEAAAAPYEYFLPILKYSANHTYSTDKLFMFRLLVKACQGGDVKTVNYLLDNYKLDPSIKANICVIEACINGHLEVVKILLKYPNVDPHDRQNKGYRWAERKGFTNIIEYLDNLH